MIIYKIKYSHGMLKHSRDRKRDHVIAFRGDDIPEELLRAIIENNILDANGTYGNPDIGEPIEYDHVVIEHEHSTVDIVFFNKGISLVMGNDDQEKRIFRVCTILQQLAAKGK